MKTAVDLAYVGLLAVAALLCPPAVAQPTRLDISPAPSVNALTEFAPDFNGEPPSDIVAIGPKLLAIIHHVTATVTFTDETGAQKATAAMPAGFRVSAIRHFADRTVLIEAGGQKKIVLPRTGADAAPVPSITAAAVAAGDPDVAAPTFVNRTWRRKGLQPQAGAGFDKELELFSLSTDRLSSATFLGTDTSGNAYSLSRDMEILPKSRDDGTHYVINVTLTVGKHDSSGKRVQVAAIPLDDLFKTPFGQFVAVDPKGSVVALLPLRAKSGRWAKGVHLFRPVFRDETTQHRSTAPNAAARETRANVLQAAGTAIASPLVGAASSNSPDLVDAPVDGQARLSGPLRTRKEMQKAAADMIGYKWRARVENLVPGAQVNCGFGKKDSAHAFELPHALKFVQAGQDVVGVPYNWGGKSSLKTIGDQLSAGYRAGNICSEIDDQSPNTTGIDCSGFVARVWGVDGFGTSNASQIARPLKTFEDLRWGDVFNLPAHHIRLYVEQDVTPEHGMRVHTLESQGACNGTCDRYYHIEHFHGFELMRLKAAGAGPIR